MSDWISVEDELPDEGQRYVAIGIPSGEAEYTSIEGKYSNKTGFIENIKYWIPIPRPPEDM